VVQDMTRPKLSGGLIVALWPNLSLNADVPHAGCARQRSAG